MLKRYDRSEEMYTILSMIGKFHDLNKCLVFYPRNVFGKEKPYELLFFFEDEVAIGESVHDENSEELVIVTRKNMQI